MIVFALYLKELNWIQKLQEALRGPWMDRFFVGWNAVDSIGFAFIVIVVVWYLINKQVGVRLLYILSLSGIINHFLKVQIDLPRPCQLDASIGLLCPSSPGFPSGAAQSAILYAGILFFECKKRLYRVLGICFALMLCFSRIYLGVHFFTDIIGGLIFGGGLLFVYKYLFPRLEKDWKKYAFLFPFLAVAVGQKWAVFQSALFTGVFIGLLLDEQYKSSGSSRWLQCISVLLVGALCLKAERIYPQYQVLFAVIAGFWISFLGAWIVNRIYKGE